MKGKINKDGMLTIARPGKKLDGEPNGCCHAPSSDCGDWCPAFREPVEFKDINGQTIFNIRLCKEVGLLYFDELIDERITAQPEERHTEIRYTFKKPEYCDQVAPYVDCTICSKAVSTFFDCRDKPIPVVNQEKCK